MNKGTVEGEKNQTIIAEAIREYVKRKPKVWGSWLIGGKRVTGILVWR